MGLFSILNGRNGHSNGVEVKSPSTAVVDIPEDLFIEKDKPQNETSKEDDGVKAQDLGINVLFQFLEKNHEGRGYDDALRNPDTMHLQQNIEALKNELERIVRRVKTFYQDYIRQINFHIVSRGRNGMIDTVEELTMKKEIADDHIKQVVAIEEQAKNNEGPAQGIIISYTRGFKNGLAAISHHTMLKRNF